MLECINKAYVLNLPYHSDRLAYFNSQIDNELKEKIEVFNAVDGHNLDLRIIDRSIISQRAIDQIKSKKIKRYGIDMTYGALGCAMSHYLILKECANSRQPYLIFEDDISLVDNISKKTIDIIRNTPKNFDVIYLGVHDIPGLNKTNIYNDFIYTPKGLICGTFGMIISPKGAKTLLNEIFPISIQIDSEISRRQNKINMFAAIKPLVKHTLKFGSSIQGKNGTKTWTL